MLLVTARWYMIAKKFEELQPRTGQNITFLWKLKKMVIKYLIY